MVRDEAVRASDLHRRPWWIPEWFTRSKKQLEIKDPRPEKPKGTGNYLATVTYGCVSIVCKWTEVLNTLKYSDRCLWLEYATLLNLHCVMKYEQSLKHYRHHTLANFLDGYRGKTGRPIICKTTEDHVRMSCSENNKLTQKHIPCF